MMVLRIHYEFRECRGSHCSVLSSPCFQFHSSKILGGCGVVREREVRIQSLVTHKCIAAINVNELHLFLDLRLRFVITFIFVRFVITFIFIIVFAFSVLIGIILDNVDPDEWYFFHMLGHFGWGNFFGGGGFFFLFCETNSFRDFF